jgi:hypothetical protein
MASETCLFIEGLKMRPTAERVLRALGELEGRPDFFQTGPTARELAERTGLDPHVVRARLCDLRRLGLAASGQCLVSRTAGERGVRYAHYPTGEGVRRATPGSHYTPRNPRE